MKIDRLDNLPIEWKRGNGLRKSDLDEKGKNKCILYGELYTKHKEVLIRNSVISRTNKKGKVLSKKGDILVPGTSTAAKKDMLLAREIDEDGIILGGDINIIRPEQGIFAKKYLPYFFETVTAYDQLDRYITGATGIIHISNKGLKKLKIPFPNIEEQKRIVSILDRAFEAMDKAKANAEQNLKNAKEIFKSYMNNIFDNPGDDWEEKKLENVCEYIFAGGDVPKNNYSKTMTEKYTIPIFTNGEKNNGLYGYSNIVRVTKPCITISARGTIGYSVIRKEKFYPAIRLIVTIPKSDILDLRFLQYVISDIDFKSSGTSIPQLTVPMIKKYKILFPLLPEQKRIVEKLDVLSAETKKLEAIYQKKIDNLEELKKSILQKAFSGRL